MLRTKHTYPVKYGARAHCNDVCQLAMSRLLSSVLLQFLSSPLKVSRNFFINFLFIALFALVLKGEKSHDDSAQKEADQLRRNRNEYILYLSYSRTQSLTLSNHAVATNEDGSLAFITMPCLNIFKQKEQKTRIRSR